MLSLALPPISSSSFSVDHICFALVNRWFLVQILQFQIKMLQTSAHSFPPWQPISVSRTSLVTFKNKRLLDLTTSEYLFHSKHLFPRNICFKATLVTFSKRLLDLTHSAYCAKSRQRTNLQDKHTLHILSTLQMTALWTMLTRTRNS